MKAEEMTETEKQQKFIDRIAPLVQKYAPEYDIQVCSPIIAQAIQESGLGESKLSKQYNNFFGMKAGSKWTGKSVNLLTTEEYTAGAITTIKDNFRVYDSIEAGVQGYFEFIQLPRYQNLRGITNPEEYIITIKADGYATEAAYVRELMQTIEKYELTKYDKKDDKKGESTMTDKDIKICGHGSGTPSVKNLHTYAEQRYQQKASNGKRKGIVCVKRHKRMSAPYQTEFVKTYSTIIGRNLYSQLRRAYVYKKYPDGKYYSDCSSSSMATMEKIGLKTGGLLSTAGIYWSDYFETVPVKIVSGHIINPEVLEVGDQILFRGNDPSRPLQIGHIETVMTIPAKKTASKATKGKITKSATIVVGEVIQGLWGEGDERKKRLTEAGYDYATIQRKVNETLKVKKTISEVAQDVIEGKYGSGTDRKKALTAAGYNYKEVQKKVNEILGHKKTPAEIAALVIAGRYGTGATRRKALTAAGYDPDVIQKEVNKQLKR